MDIIQSSKTCVRRVEARLTRNVRTVTFRGQQFRFVKSLWWDESGQDYFDKEIAPYFEAMRERPILSVVDAGASVGSFSVAIARMHPDATVYAFEPAARNRILLGRNLKLNGVNSRVRIVPCGLWDRDTRLRFRTHGGVSSFEESGMIGKEMGFSFNEWVPVKRLDQWASEVNLTRLDLVKMDIECSEIEALAGAENTLRTLKPDLLVQAYHIRDGNRTFERCKSMLEGFGYSCEEIKNQPGCLVAAAK